MPDRSIAFRREVATDETGNWIIVWQSFDPLDGAIDVDSDILFVAGFGWYWWESRGFMQPPSGGSLVLMGLAAIAYVLVRAMLFRSRQLHRQMRQRTGPG